MSQRNHSPWLAEMHRSRAVKKFSSDQTTDVVIVGGGIAGIMTAFCILRDTDLRVTLVEAQHVGQGASGHNAGIMLSFMEREFESLVEEFGKKAAAQAWRDIDMSWNVFRNIVREVHTRTPIYYADGYAGLISKKQILSFLERCRVMNATIDTLIAPPAILRTLPQKYTPWCVQYSAQRILQKLHTTDSRYIAAQVSPIALTNSAALSEEIARFIVRMYHARFRLYESSPVDAIVLDKAAAHVRIQKHTLHAQHVVLCTNGYSNFRLTDLAHPQLTHTLRSHLVSTIGYAAGYTGESSPPPMSAAYFDGDDAAAYRYVSRRPYAEGDIFCIGGPEEKLARGNIYNPNKRMARKHLKSMDQFLHRYLTDSVSRRSFQWHGVMGYTSNGLRWVGRSKANSRLLFNLGCNGVGLLASVLGAQRISNVLSNKKFPRSIFDPPI